MLSTEASDDAESLGALTIGDVTVRFEGLTALDGVSFDVPAGEVVGVIGPNGAGKTTLFNAICGFVRPATGRLHYRGRSLNDARPHQLASLGIARTLQGVGLFGDLTALENVMVGAGHGRRPGVWAAMLGIGRSDRSERAIRATATEALTALDVPEELTSRRASTLPYPIQKRIALARALAAQPSLLLLDEPAGGLGADDVESLTTLIRGWRGAMTIMLVEHRMDLVMSVCDRVVVLDSGRLVASGTPAEVQQDARVLEAYLGAEEDTTAVERT